MSDKLINLEDLENEIRKISQKRKLNYSYRDDFKYKSLNPYNEKIKDGHEFALVDNDGEQFASKWNELIFKNDLPIHAEIGSGYGHFMVEYCRKNPHVNFIGMDYRFKRSFALSRKLDELEEKNFKYLRAKGERIGHLFGSGEVEHLFYFFPDPWPKKRYHKNRLFQEIFLEDVHRILTSNGKLLVKTDHDEYFEWMKIVLKIYQENNPDKQFKVNLIAHDLYQEAPKHFLSSFQTKFEKIFLKQNINIKAMELEKL